MFKNKLKSIFQTKIYHEKVFKNTVYCAFVNGISM